MEIGKSKNIKEDVLNLLEKSNRPIFVTGKAGTGKSTLLIELKEIINKNSVVAAPTAVAAINARGITLHSLFQLSYGPWFPQKNITNSLVLRLSKEKLEILTKLEILIIDEISMVRADVIDQIDFIMQKVKGTKLPFGGIQLMMYGDLYQLPPVYERDWPSLSQYYKSPYFFDALVFKRHPIEVLELNKVFRQSDEQFVAVLNAAREGNISEMMLERLNTRIISERTQYEGYITISTHLKLVNQINDQNLSKLTGSEYCFEAEVKGAFPNDVFPAEEKLKLKVGAMVIFIKNDLSGNNKFYNGKTAKVIQLNTQEITVEFLEDRQTFKVARELWYYSGTSIDDSENGINEKPLGSFLQFPLRLSWAITVHKSQGLSFEKAILNIENSFANGQAYVALSRCRTWEGLLITARLKPEYFKVDPVVNEFTSIHLSQLGNRPYENFEKEYDILASIIDFEVFYKEWKIIQNHYSSQGSIDERIKKILQEIDKLLLDKLNGISKKFIEKEFTSSDYFSDDNREKLRGRLKACINFLRQPLEDLEKSIDKLVSESSGKKFKPDLFYALNNLIRLLKSRQIIYSKSINFSTIGLLQEKINISLLPSKQIFNFNTSESNKDNVKINHSEPYEDIMEWRTKIAQEKSVAEYLIIGEHACKAIAKKMPNSILELSRINGVGEFKALEYGAEILQIIFKHQTNSRLF